MCTYQVYQTRQFISPVANPRESLGISACRGIIEPQMNGSHSLAENCREISRTTGRWSDPFAGFSDDSGFPSSGRPPRLADETKAGIVREIVRPPAGQTRWSTRTMAKAKGVSNATVH